MDSRVRSASLMVLAVLFAAGTVLAGGGDSQVLKYSVLAKGKKIGWSKAVVKDTTKGKAVTVTVKMKTTVLGQEFSMDTRMKTVYDDQGRASYFESKNDGLKGKFEITGKRGKGGTYLITRTEGDGDPETESIPAESFDVLSVEPGLYDGNVGSKEKKKVLFTSSGKVRKVTVTVLSKSEQQVMGESRMVTHFSVKGMHGSMEEWRSDDGILVKSKISTPLGKIFIKLTGMGG